MVIPPFGSTFNHKLKALRPTPEAVACNFLGTRETSTTAAGDVWEVLGTASPLRFLRSQLFGGSDNSVPDSGVRSPRKPPEDLPLRPCLAMHHNYSYRALLNSGLPYKITILARHPLQMEHGTMKRVAFVLILTMLLGSIACAEPQTATPDNTVCPDFHGSASWTPEPTSTASYYRQLPRFHRQTRFHRQLPRFHRQTRFHRQLPRFHGQTRFHRQLPRFPLWAIGGLFLMASTLSPKLV